MASSSQLAYNSALVLQAISADLEKEWRGNWEYANLVRFMGEMASSQRDNYPSGLGSNRPIVMIDNPWVWKGQQHKGGGNRWGRAEQLAQIDTGKTGDTSIEGTGVMPDFMHQEGYVNAKRFITRIESGPTNRQDLGAWGQKIRDNGGPELYDQANRFASSHGIRAALHWGYSSHILEAAATGGFAVTRRWHPDLCCPGLPAGRNQSTTVGAQFTTWSATTATFETYLAQKVAQVEGTAHYMSVELLERLAILARRRIRPIMIKNGKPVYAMELTLEQFAQLRADPEFRESLQLWPGTPDQSDVYFSSFDAKYASFYIFDTVRGAACRIYAAGAAGGGEDTLTEIAGGLTAANATRLFIGPLNDALTSDATAMKSWMSLNPDDLDSYIPVATAEGAALHKHCGIIWGEAAIYGVNVPMDEPLTRELRDHKAVEDMALTKVFGFSRCDFYDNPAPASATIVRSNRSMPFVTHTPPL